jgi:hypothetical protein
MTVQDHQKTTVLNTTEKIALSSKETTVRKKKLHPAAEEVSGKNLLSVKRKVLKKMFNKKRPVNPVFFSF